MKKIALLCAVAFFAATLPLFALSVSKLDEKDCRTLDSILAKTKPLIELKERTGNSNLLTFKEFYSKISRKEKKLIKQILKLTPADLNVKTPKQEMEKTKPAWKEVKGQKILKDGKPFILPPQAVSLPAYEAYEKMMQAMQKALGKRLYIESGHRSLAYHLYNFLKYLREHGYSLTDTAKLNALPGYSEHNLLVYHAIDLINAEGVNGEPKVEDYEKLPEHQWMLKHAGEFGFTLSYPKNNPYGIDFEPWHWRYQPSLASAAPVQPAATAKK